MIDTTSDRSTINLNCQIGKIINVSFHFRLQNNRFQKSPSPAQTTPELATYSVFSEPSSTAAPSLGSGGRRFSPSPNARRKSNKEKEYSYKDESSGKSDRSRFKNKENKIVASNVESSTSSSIYKFKLQRPSGKWDPVPIFINDLIIIIKKLQMLQHLGPN